MPSPQEILTHFSITQDEADIYIALLTLGTASATQIAHAVKKNRTATHFHLKKLIEKDLVQFTKRGRIFVFFSVPPSELASRFDRVATDFKSIVPQLEALNRMENDSPRIHVSESRSGFFAVYDEISSLPEHGTFYAIEGARALQNELQILTPEIARSFYTKMVERDITVKLILTKEATRIPAALMTKENHALFQQRKIDARVHDEATLPFQGLTLLYGDTVAHIIPEKDMVITIKHQGIADSFRATFEALFAFGSPYSFQK